MSQSMNSRTSMKWKKAIKMFAKTRLTKKDPWPPSPQIKEKQNATVYTNIYNMKKFRACLPPKHKRNQTHAQNECKWPSHSLDSKYKKYSDFLKNDPHADGNQGNANDAYKKVRDNWIQRILSGSGSINPLFAKTQKSLKHFKGASSVTLSRKFCDFFPKVKPGSIMRVNASQMMAKRKKKINKGISFFRTIERTVDQERIRKKSKELALNGLKI